MEMETMRTSKTKQKEYKQKPKQGKVVRINPDTFKLLSTVRGKKEPMVALIERLIKAALYKGINKGRSYYILPDSQVVCSTEADARGKAILAAVLKKKKQAETPILVREVS